MAWSTPLTAVANAALTAAQWNASVRDNMLLTPAALFTQAGQIIAASGANAPAARFPDFATVATQQTRSTTSYGDLTTVGPSLTITIGARCLVLFGCQLANDTLGANSYMSYDCAAASITASDSFALQHRGNANDAMQAIYSHFISTGTPGSATFTAKYKVSSGIGTFQDRRMQVIPF